MLAVVELVLPLFGLIFLGYVAGRLARIPFEGLAWMNFFIVYVALPALFYQLLSNTPVQQFSNVSFIAVSILATFIIFCLVFLLAKRRNGNNTSEATIQGLAAAYGNIGYLGPPLALAAFGPAAGVPVALIFCFENAMHFTLAPLLIALDHKEQQQAAKLIKGILYNIFTHPFILATIAGVLAAVFSFKPPIAVASLLEFLARAAGPCALFTMGVTAALRPLKRIPFELSYIMPIKLVLHPLLAYLLLVWLVPGLDPIWLYSAVLLATLPTATNVFVIAQQYNVWQERASSVVVISTLFAMESVTAFLFMVQSGWLNR
jgi:malonate transporter